MEKNHICEFDSRSDENFSNEERLGVGAAYLCRKPHFGLKFHSIPVLVSTVSFSERRTKISKLE